MWLDAPARGYPRLCADDRRCRAAARPRCERAPCVGYIGRRALKCWWVEYNFNAARIWSNYECRPGGMLRSEEHTSELQSLMRISYAVFCLKIKTRTNLYTFSNNADTRIMYI